MLRNWKPSCKLSILERTPTWSLFQPAPSWQICSLALQSSRQAVSAQSMQNLCGMLQI